MITFEVNWIHMIDIIKHRAAYMVIRSGGGLETLVFSLMHVPMIAPGTIQIIPIKKYLF